MLVHWGYTSALEKIETERLTHAAAEALRAHRRGYHWVVLDRKVGEVFAKLPLGEVDLSLARRLAGNYAQTGAMHLSAARFLAVVGDNSDPVPAHGIAVSIEDIANGELLSPATLLVENAERDGWYYTFLMRNAGDLAGVSSVYVDTAHGGGDDINGVLASLLARRRVVHTVVDTDKKSPNSKGNAKAGKIRKTISDLGSSVAFLSVTPGKEVENLIPMDVVLSFPGSALNKSSSLLIGVEEIEVKKAIPAADRLWMYFDVKVGINSEEVAKMTSDEAQWLSDRLDLIGVELEKCDMPGYGGKTIDVLKTAGERSAECRRHVRSAHWQFTGNAFVRDIAWTFCAPRPLRT